MKGFDWQHIILISILLIGPSHSIASDLLETNPELEGLPKQIVFDCTDSANEIADYMNVFGRKVRVPKNFQRSETNDAWFNWNVLVVADDGSSAVVPFAAFHIGEHGSEADNFFEEFSLESERAANSLDVDVLVRNRQSGDVDTAHWVFFLQDGSFLKVVSAVPVDWTTLIACFE